MDGYTSRKMYVFGVGGVGIVKTRLISFILEYLPPIAWGYTS